MFPRKLMFSTHAEFGTKLTPSVCSGCGRRWSCCSRPERCDGRNRWLGPQRHIQVGCGELSGEGDGFLGEIRHTIGNGTPESDIAGAEVSAWLVLVTPGEVGRFG